ncbi:hypothetical protein CXG81DRAFT_6699, partial [Caulochytrium protostelioides]
VILDASVALQIIQSAGSSSASFTESVSGQLLGIDRVGRIEATASFPFMNKQAASADATDVAETSDVSQYDHHRQMLSVYHSTRYEASPVGWYHATAAPIVPWTQPSFIETQLSYQRTLPRSLALVYSAPQTALTSNLSFKAFRLTPAFMRLFASAQQTDAAGHKTHNAHSKGSFTLEALAREGISPADIFEVLEVQIKNSALLNAFLWNWEATQTAPAAKSSRFTAPTSAYAAASADLIGHPSLPFSMPPASGLNLNSDAPLTNHLTSLMVTLENLHHTHNRALSSWHRHLDNAQREHAASVQKKKLENAAAIAAGKEPIYPEASLTATASAEVAKVLAEEPSRYDMLLTLNQIEEEVEQMTTGANTGLVKAFLAKA